MDWTTLFERATEDEVTIEEIETALSERRND